MASGLVALLVTILIVGLVLGIVIYLIRRMPIIPAEFRQIAEVIVIVIALIVIVGAALPLMGVHAW